MGLPETKNKIDSIDAYVGGESKLVNKPNAIKLSSNEGAFGPSPMAMDAYKAHAKAIYRYPDGSAKELRATLASKYELDPNRIVCGSGSDEIISLLCQSYAGYGDEVLHCEHGFLMYAISARIAGATPIAAPETNLTADVTSIMSKVTNKTRIVFIANPNNPTGTYLSRMSIESLWRQLPENIILVLDAAYAEYVTEEDYFAGCELVDKSNNVVVTRTFSKIHALGGLRLGWAYCPQIIADALNISRGPFNVNSAALAAGKAALNDSAFTEMVRDETIKCRQWTSNQLKLLANKGVSVTKSVGNFLLLELGSDTQFNAAACDRFMRENGIIIRCLDNYKLPQHIRVSIGRMSEMQAFVKAMKLFLENVKS